MGCNASRNKDIQRSKGVSSPTKARPSSPYASQSPSHGRMVRGKSAAAVIRAEEGMDEDAPLLSSSVADKRAAEFEYFKEIIDRTERHSPKVLEGHQSMLRAERYSSQLRRLHVIPHRAILFGIPLRSVQEPDFAPLPQKDVSYIRELVSKMALTLSSIRVVDCGPIVVEMVAIPQK